jgi:membrane-bound metal-dependent hydrolase YbcI (DUF457 family)
MPSVGHIAVGLAGARLQRVPAGIQGWVWSALFVILSCLPDADTVAFALGIPYRAPFGHRGAFHLLAFSGLCGFALGLAARSLNLPALRLGVAGGAIVASLVSWAGAHGPRDDSLRSILASRLLAAAPREIDARDGSVMRLTRPAPAPEPRR